MKLIAQNCYIITQYTDGNNIKCDELYKKIINLWHMSNKSSLKLFIIKIPQIKKNPPTQQYVSISEEDYIEYINKKNWLDLKPIQRIIGGLESTHYSYTKQTPQYLLDIINTSLHLLSKSYIESNPIVFTIYFS